MKRVVVGLFLLLFTAAAGTASAQTALQFNIKGGINFSSVSGSAEDLDKNAHLGGVFGAGVSTPINDRWNFDVDVLFSEEGVKLEGTDDDLSVKADVHSHYLRIPLLFRTNIGAGPRSPYVVVGPNIGFLLSSKIETEVSDGDETVEDEIDNKDDSKKADFGLTFGVGGNVTERLFIEARYTLGLTEIDAEHVEEEDAHRNRTFTVLIGGRF